VHQEQGILAVGARSTTGAVRRRAAPVRQPHRHAARVEQAQDRHQHQGGDMERRCVRPQARNHGEPPRRGDVPRRGGSLPHHDQVGNALDRHIRDTLVPSHPAGLLPQPLHAPDATNCVLSGRADEKITNRCRGILQSCFLTALPLGGSPIRRARRPFPRIEADPVASTAARTAISVTPIRPPRIPAALVVFDRLRQPYCARTESPGRRATQVAPSRMALPGAQGASVALTHYALRNAERSPYPTGQPR